MEFSYHRHACALRAQVIALSTALAFFSSRSRSGRGSPASTRQQSSPASGSLWTTPRRVETTGSDQLPSQYPTIPIPDAGAAIVLERLTKRYGSFTAVHDVSLTVQPGEILAFLGSNGAGKSTTIRMMTGVLQPTAGRVLIHGRDIWQEDVEARRLVGYVPDTPLLYESLTAQEYLWFVGGLYGLDPRSARVVKDLILAEARQGAAVFLTTHILDVAGELAQTPRVKPMEKILTE